MNFELLTFEYTPYVTCYPILTTLIYLIYLNLIIFYKVIYEHQFKNIRGKKKL